MRRESDNAVVFLRGILYSMLRLMCVIMMSCVGTVFFIWCVIGIEFDEGQLLGEMNV